VVSTAINKYMYIVVNKRFDDTIRVSYARTEIVKDVDEKRIYER
jgi:D-glycero-alpha-D-manno-heptose-7-phosphate kinase